MNNESGSVLFCLAFGIERNGRADRVQVANIGIVTVDDIQTHELAITRDHAVDRCALAKNNRHAHAGRQGPSDLGLIGRNEPVPVV